MTSLSPGVAMQAPSASQRVASEAADKAAAVQQGQPARPPPPAAASGSARRRALTLPEMRTKAAFRACLRLMERGVEGEEQMWSVARPMSGEEFEQAAEERALAGRCGNPLCSAPPAAPPTSPGASGSGKRYSISTSERAVYELPPPDDRPLYCGAACEAAVHAFAARLGSGALALERFSALYQQLKAQESAVQAEAKAAAAAAPADAGSQQQADSSSNSSSSSAAAESASASPAAAAATAAAGSSAGSPPVPEDAGRIGSAATLAPRLAVEQVAVQKIDSSAGQFGDFSYKPPPRPAAAAAAAGPPKPAPAAPRGVLKKQSRFAAGTPKVPIMLAEVKERDPAIVQADTARSLPAEGGAASGRSRGSGARAATAVEGYVPRAINSQRSRRERRVRWSDELEEEEEEAATTGGSSSPASAQQQQQQPEPEQQAAPPASPLEGRPIAPAATSSAATSGSSSAPAVHPAAHPAAATPAGASGAAPVLVFDVEDPAGPLEAGATGLATQMGRLRVADAAALTPDAAAIAAATAFAAQLPSRQQPAPRSPSPTTARSPSSTLAARAERSPPTSSIQIRGRGGSGSSGMVRSGSSEMHASPSPLVLPPEWREVPQFYAHSPMGSSNSLAGSLASPGGSSGNLSALAAVGSPPPRTTRPAVSSPPGLPRGPSGPSSQRGAAAANGGTRLGASPAAPAAPTAGLGSAAAAPAEPAQWQQQGEQQQQPASAGSDSQPAAAAAAAEEPLLTKRQAAQLRSAFPPLSGVLPPELQAVLGSDSESEAAESDWTRSDDEEQLVIPSSSDDEGEGEGGPGGRSAYRLQLTFFGSLYSHLEAWVTPATVELLASEPSAVLTLPPPVAPEAAATLDRVLAQALPPVLTSLQAQAPRSDIERSLEELVRSLRLAGPLPPFRVAQWQVLAVLLLKALSLERCPALRPAFESREGIARLGRLLASLTFTSEEFYAALEVLCPVPET